LPAGVSYTQVSAILHYTCGLRSDGSLTCWGSNTYGQTDVVGYTQISAGGYHTCGLRSDGSLVCWGHNYYGQTNVPDLPAEVSYTQTSAGGYHTCGLRSDGSLVCWGSNWDSQTNIPPLPTGVSYTQVSAGGYHTCGLRSNGSLICWGENDDGQTSVPALPAEVSYTQVSAGLRHTCGLRSDGSLICWGRNTAGQTNVPTLPAGVSYTQAGAGGIHTCGLRSNGSLVCWGWNDDGQTDVPTPPAGLSYTQVSAGEAHTCGLRSDGSLVCWGDNSSGQTNVPALPAGASYTQFSAGGYHTCGLCSDGSLVCWGSNSSGQAAVPRFGRDITAPFVTSSLRASANPTNAGSVAFNVTFSEFVVGVDATDFTPTTTGVSGAAVTGVSGSGSTYIVTVSTGSGEGTLRLDVAANGSIRDAVNQPLNSAYTGGQIYTVDHISPTVVSAVRADPNPTGAASVAFDVTFSEGVKNVDKGDFDLVTGDLSGADITGVSGSGSAYVVTVSTGSGSGTLQLTIPTTASITDDAGNALDNLPFAGETYDIDKTAPTVVSALRADPNPTNAASVDFSVTFSEVVTGVDSADFGLVTGGDLSGTLVSGVSGAGSAYTVTVDTGTGSGALQLTVPTTATITDDAGNALGSLPFAGEAYDIDKTVPAVVSTVRAGPNPTNAASVAFDVTFSEGVKNVGSGDFGLVTGGGLSGAAITGVSGSGSAYVVTVSTGSGSGTLQLTVPTTATITDDAGNPLGNLPFAGEAYEIDKTAPTVVSALRADPNPTGAASVAFHVTFSKAVTDVDAADFGLATSGDLSGTAVSGVSGGGSTYTVTVDTGTGNGTLQLTVPTTATITDGAGNALDNLPFDGEAYDVDKTAPTVVSALRADPNPTGAASVDFSVTFSKAVTDVDSADFGLAATGSLSGTLVSGVSGAGSTYTVTVDTGTGNGTLQLTVPTTATITDGAGNALDNLPFDGEAYEIDKTAPTVVSALRADPNPTGAASVDFSVTFSKAVTDVDAADFGLVTSSDLSGTLVSGVSGGGSTYTVTVDTGTGNGTLQLTVPATATITDGAGNGLDNLPFTGEIYEIDKTAPMVVSAVRAGPSPTGAESVMFSVTFSGMMRGVETADFDLTTGGSLSGTAVSGVSGGGSVYTVTVDTGTGSGTLQLTVPATATLTDDAGNALGNLPFTGEIYEIDKSAPTVVSAVRADPNPTNATSVAFNVTFSEVVTGVDASDLSLTTSGDISGALVSRVSGGGSTYTVTVDTGTGSGTLQLTVPATATITDAAGNALGNLPFTGGETYNIERTTFAYLPLVLRGSGGHAR
jgi:alpha-tubulin suppressor-like RCC1 family protein/uncharacterized lipoprotein YmbA